MAAEFTLDVMRDAISQCAVDESEKHSDRVEIKITVALQSGMHNQTGIYLYHLDNTNLKHATEGKLH